MKKSKTPKKPSKKPQVIEKEDNDCIHEFVDYVPDDLRKIANRMEEQNILSVRIEIRGYEGYFEAVTKRLETKEQAKARYEKELITYQKSLNRETQKKEKRKKALLAEAKSLGLKIVE